MNVTGDDLDAVIVTHEHTDHIQSLGNLSKKFNLPVYATSETFDNMPKQSEKISDNNKKNITINQKFAINDIDIIPFAIPHDAANPCGFTFFSDNKKISIATDIGHMTNDVLNHGDTVSLKLTVGYNATATDLPVATVNITGMDVTFVYGQK